MLSKLYREINIIQVFDFTVFYFTIYHFAPLVTE